MIKLLALTMRKPGEKSPSIPDQIQVADHLLKIKYQINPFSTWICTISLFFIVLSIKTTLKILTLWQREGYAWFLPVRARCVEWAWRRFDDAATCRVTATLPSSCQKCQLEWWFFSQKEWHLISFLVLIAFMITW